VLDLRLAADGESWTGEWHVPEEQRVRFAVGPDGVRPDCRDRTPGLAVTRLQNADGDPHRVRIEIEADDALVAARTYDVPARSSIPEVSLGGVSDTDDGTESTATGDGGTATDDGESGTSEENATDDGTPAEDDAPTLPATSADAARYDLRVVVDGDRELTATWTVCDPDDELAVEIDSGGAPQLFSPTRGLIRVRAD
jgi:hypothetical protein